MAVTENGHIELSDALKKTFKMLDYSTHRGIKLTSDDIANVVVAERALRDNNITDAQEVAFWSSASAISKAIAPVTIESLNASLPQRSGWRGRSLAASAASRYRVLTVLTLAALLLFQIYWLVGATVITDLKEIRTRLEKFGLEYDPLKRSYDELTAQKPPGDQVQVAKLKGQLEDLDSRVRVDTISASTNFAVLRNWNVAKYLLLWTSTEEIIANAQQDPNPTYFLWVFTPENVVEMQTAQIILTALIKYILPILYGMLGAATYIARFMANEIKDATYSLESKIRYQLRFALGAVAGFSIAWFTSDVKQAESVGVLQSLSPLALAFLAGYSVDLLFSLLDRLVLAFSGPAPRPTP